MAGNFDLPCDNRRLAGLRQMEKQKNIAHSPDNPVGNIGYDTLLTEQAA
jgi:hypothetical protein